MDLITGAPPLARRGSAPVDVEPRILGKRRRQRVGQSAGEQVGVDPRPQAPSSKCTIHCAMPWMVSVPR